MDDGTVTINILGCCVSRDTIEQRKDKYIVPRYAAFVSPWSMFSGNKVDVPNEKLTECGV